jgi:hypothetical protein
LFGEIRQAPHFIGIFRENLLHNKPTRIVEVISTHYIVWRAREKSTYTATIPDEIRVDNRSQIGVCILAYMIHDSRH